MGGRASHVAIWSTTATPTSLEHAIIAGNPLALPETRSSSTRSTSSETKSPERRALEHPCPTAASTASEPCSKASRRETPAPCRSSAPSNTSNTTHRPTRAGKACRLCLRGSTAVHTSPKPTSPARGGRAGREAGPGGGGDVSAALPPPGPRREARDTAPCGHHDQARPARRRGSRWPARRACGSTRWRASGERRAQRGHPSHDLSWIGRRRLRFGQLLAVSGRHLSEAPCIERTSTLSCPAPSPGMVCKAPVRCCGVPRVASRCTTSRSSDRKPPSRSWAGAACVCAPTFGRMARWRFDIDGRVGWRCERAWLWP